MNGESVQDYLNRGKQFSDAGEFTQAIACYQKAKQQQPNFAEIYQRLAEFMLGMEKEKRRSRTRISLVISTKIFANILSRSEIRQMKNHRGTEDTEGESLSSLRGYAV